MKRFRYATMDDLEELLCVRRNARHFDDAHLTLHREDIKDMLRNGKGIVALNEGKIFAFALLKLRGLPKRAELTHLYVDKSARPKDGFRYGAHLFEMAMIEGLNSGANRMLWWTFNSARKFYHEVAAPYDFIDEGDMAVSLDALVVRQPSVRRRKRAQATLCR